MNLTAEQIRELIKNPKNRVHIERAARDNRWQEFHAKPSTSKEEVLPYYNLFIEKVSKILKNDKKTKIFEDLLSFPLPSTRVISKASDEWNKIYTAQDRTIEYYFEDESLQDNFRKYLDEIGIQEIVEQKVFTAAKQAVNTFVVVDFPSDLVSEVNEGNGADGDRYDGISVTGLFGMSTDDNYVKPFVYLLDAGFVIDADEDEKGNIEYIIFKAGGENNEKIIAIDDEYFRVFKGPDDANPIENKHDLGFCPVCTVWSDNIGTNIPIRRFNAVTEALSDLDEYVQYHVFSRHTHLYSGFPIVTRYVSRCTYVDHQNNPCVNGLINIVDPVNGKAVVVECPACRNSSDLVGPGTLANIPLPTDKDQPTVPDTIIEFVTPSTAILEYNKNIVKEKEAAIMFNLTGGELKVTDKDAINEDQVRSQYEQKQDILVYWAENIQKVHKFIVDTIGVARYGDKYKGSTINYGYNFFLIDMNIAVKEYKDAVEAGLPQYIVAEKRSAVEAIYVRRSPERSYRIQLLRMLEPYLDTSLDKVPKDSLDYALKSNFSRYIDLYEAEIGPITQIGLNVSLSKRVKSIQQKLYDYVYREQKNRENFLRKFRSEEGVSPLGENTQGSGNTPVEGGLAGGGKDSDKVQ